MPGNSLPSWCVGKKYADVAYNHEYNGSAKLFPDLIEGYQAKHVAEIGVAQGNMAKRIVKQFKGKVLKYMCVDPWIPYPEWSDRPWKEFELSAAWWEEMFQNVSAWAKENPEVVVRRMTSMEAARHTVNESLNGVYLDGIHDFPNFVCDVWAWLPKIAPGGFIGGHDYVKRFSSMIEAADMIFGQDLRLIHKHGGCWFAHVNETTRNKYLSVIRRKVGNDPMALLHPPNLFKQEATA